MVKRKTKKNLQFKVRDHKVTVLLDKILLFRLFRSLHGRFWGVAFIVIMLVGLSVCFAVKVEPVSWSIAFSYFSNNVRTAPYFAGTMFFSAYSLWRWRNYLSRTLNRSRPLTGLLTLTIIGFYLVALMPISWHPWPYRLHIAGVFIAGLSMAATVVVDTLLSKTRRNQHTSVWRSLRLIAFSSIIIGGYISYCSLASVGLLNLSLLGELLMLFGYGIWIIVKTYQGETNRSVLSMQLKSLVLMD